MDSPKQARLRSLLFTPGNQPRKLDRVFDFGADAVNLDLEDAVPPSEKGAARSLVRETLLRRAGQPGPRIVVRVNSPESGLIEDDLEAVVQPGVFAIQLTKVGGLESIPRIDASISTLEATRGIRPGSIQLISSVDSPELVLSLPELVRTSERFYCVIVGGADFAMSLGLTVSDEMSESLWARSYAVLVSRAAGLAPPMHPPHFNLTDLERYDRLMLEGKRLGFQGGIALHPRQVARAHAIFSVAEDEVRRARETIIRFDAALAQGQGAVQLDDGSFVDPAIIRWAEEVLRRASDQEQSISSPGTKG
jgi:citrate lyase subunit beta / citryl-CoA lyase